MNNMTPTEALQLISEALEPKNISQISRQGFVAIQTAIETLAKAIKANAESSVEGRESSAETPTPSSYLPATTHPFPCN